MRRKLMRGSFSSAVRRTAPLLLCDAVYTALTATFAPARLLLCWNDQPIVVPGFQVRPDGAHAIVRYIQPRVGTPQSQRAHACAMLEQYQQVLLAQGWQVDLVDEPRRTPYLRCRHTNIVMSIGD